METFGNIYQLVMQKNTTAFSVVGKCPLPMPAGTHVYTSTIYTEQLHIMPIDSILIPKLT